MSDPILPHRDDDREGTSTATHYANVAPEHVQELEASAIPAAVAADQGVYTANKVDDLPEWALRHVEKHGTGTLPALVYPMVHPDGTATGQVKFVPGSVTNADGHVQKYVSPLKDQNPPKLPVLRVVNDPAVVLIVEGVKQALAALAWAPDDWSIYRITGIWSWRVTGDDGAPGTPTPYLAAVQRQDVVIVPDADAATNVRVFDGAAALGKACEEYGAKSVRFARLPGGGKDGLDDVLARLADDDARRSMLASWVTGAKAKPADLDKRELDKMRRQLRDRDVARSVAAVAAQAGDDRVSINVDEDPRQVSLELVDALVERRGGTRLFSRDEGIVRLRRKNDPGTGGYLVVKPLGNRGGLHRELLDVVQPITVGQQGARPCGVSSMLLDLVDDHPDRFPVLVGITRSPIVRADGSVNTTSGYDPATGLYLDLTKDVQDIDVPEHPSDADIQWAVVLLRDDLFAMDGVGGYDGWVFQDVADQTHAIAGLLTPMIRVNIPLAPILVFDGLQRSVGKGGAVDVIHKVAFGTPAPLQAAPKDDAEMEKRITAKVDAGATIMVLDEVQPPDGPSRLVSAALTTATTSQVHEGRRLGVSEMVCLRNVMTFYALGNNVQLPGDVVRRVYTCRMSSDRADLETRDNFRHDLDTWVPENRAALLRAALILIRAWYDRGQPPAPRAFGFKSYTEWQRVIGGILHLAGIRDFLSTVLDVRETADSEAVDNREHWEWVAGLFPVGTRFGASQVVAHAKADPDAPAPYGLSWGDVDAKVLSTFYGQHPRWYGDLRIRHDGKLHGRGKAYVIDRLQAGVTAIPAAPTAPPASPGPRTGAGAAPGEVIEFTDRHGFTQRAARTMPSIDGKTIAELSGDAS
ncbi:hypothetical protein [Nostocoides vanveenii]|uniref:DUF3854 domain-containing protein n=1 Tax=Nostocoides vanveenii TaxID=330835 RepID=A0ABN2L0H6_9MICO